MKSKPSSVQEYLAQLSPHDRVVVNAMRELIQANIAAGFVETLAWGFPTFQVPLDRATATYDGEPMVFAAVEAGKRTTVLYLTPLYNGSEAEADFQARWRSPSRRMVEFRAGHLRFRDLADLDKDLIAECVASMTMEEFIASYHRDPSG